MQRTVLLPIFLHYSTASDGTARTMSSPLPTPDDALRSAYEIRRAMGQKFLQYLKRKDPALYQRDRTKALKRKVLRQYGPTCLICDRKEPRVEIEAAHVKPIQEGGESDLLNLVPLCSEDNGELGCHQLYDRGFLSRLELRRFQSKRIRNPKLRRNMLRLFSTRQRNSDIARPLPTGVRVPNIGPAAYTRERKTGLRTLRLALKCAEKRGDTKSEFFIGLQRADLLRRGRSASAPIQAYREILRCQKLLKSIPLPYKARFYYEHGYVLHLLGKIEEAKIAYRNSAKIAHIAGDGWGCAEEIAATTQEAVLEMLALPTRGPDALPSLLPVEKRLIDAENKARKLGSAIGNRFVVSCLIHRAGLYVKARDAQKAKKLFNKAVRYRDSLDATSGWTADAHMLLLTDLLIGTIENQKRSHSHNRLLKMCSRTLRDMLTNSAKSTEGIKDALIALGQLLENRDDMKDLAKNAKSIADRTCDPFSGLL